jgi:hypothetical protein
MLQYLRVVCGSRDKACMFDSVLYHFSRHLVKDNVSHLQANAFRQAKMFMCAREI